MTGLLRAYLHRRRGEIALFCAMLLVMGGVYWLYGLPAGPALYAGLLMTALALGAAALDYGAFSRKVEVLRRLGRQTESHLDGLPAPADRLEEEAFAIIKALDRRCAAGEEAARQEGEKAAQYYTLWSHQVKTPLSAMRLLLEEEPIDRPAVEEELFKMEQYVKMALQYQRLGQGEGDLLLQEYPLEGMVKEALKGVSTLFIRKRVQVELLPIPGRVVTDEKWMVFVLEQILTNAVKYTPSGGRVTLGPAPGIPDSILVEDTGIGIRPEDLPRVGEWGYTGGNGRLEHRSTGVGLALCREALSRLGHTMEIRSQVGKGTAVTLRLARRRLEVE